MTRIKNVAKKVSSKKAVKVKKGMKDYNNDPFFKRKAEAMQELLKKEGLPAPARVD